MQQAFISYVEMISELMFLMRLQNVRFRQLVSGDLERFPFVRIELAGRSSQLANEIGFFQSFFPLASAEAPSHSGIPFRI